MNLQRDQLESNSTARDYFIKYEHDQVGHSVCQWSWHHILSHTTRIFKEGGYSLEKAGSGGAY